MDKMGSAGCPIKMRRSMVYIAHFERCNMPPFPLALLFHGLLDTQHEAKNIHGIEIAGRLAKTRRNTDRPCCEVLMVALACLKWR
jgi:hypothetical protein